MYRNPTYASVAAGEAISDIDLEYLSTAVLPVLFDPAGQIDGQSIPAHEIRRYLQNMDAGREARLSQDLVMSTSRKAQQREHGPAQTEHAQPPFVPTYLRDSRYIERIDAAFQRSQRDTRQRSEQVDKNPSDQVSGRPSRVPSLNQIAGLKQESGRGPVGDARGLIGNSTAAPTRPVIDSPSPLPTRWSEQDKFPSLVVSRDGTEVLLKDEVKSTDDAAAVKADYPIPKECGIYYFEITLLSKGMVGIGLSGAKSSVARLPGWEQQSWGYHGDDGLLYCCSATAGKPYGPSFTEHDVIGCGIDFRLHHIFFTKNGVFLGYPCGDAAQEIMCDRLYPTIGMKKKNDNVKTNFGQVPFVFDIDSMVEATRRNVRRDIANTITVRDQTFVAQQETEAIQRLVAQYLSHEGHVDTARLFSAEIQQQRKHILPESSWSATSGSIDDDSAVGRQKIRSAVLDGDMDLALTLITQDYPKVLHQGENQDIYFRLRCRKFTEMVIKFNKRRQQSHPPNESTQDPSSAVINEANSHDRIAELKHVNGNSSTSLNAMDIDDPSKNNAGPLPEPDSDVVNYGTELTQEFGSDARPEIQDVLNDIFAPLCYPNRADDALDDGKMNRERIDLAEDINGAILVSQGKPREALLNTTCAQTEVLLDMLASKGGAATMINVKRDYLRDDSSRGLDL